MTVTAQRRQPPVVPLTLTSDLHLQQSPQQLSPTLSSPINITQVRTEVSLLIFFSFPVTRGAIKYSGTNWGDIFLLTLVCIHLSVGCANWITNPGTTAFPVPFVQSADSSGPGSAHQWPPEAAGPLSRHPAHHSANSGLLWYSHCKQSLPRQPDHRQHEHQLGMKQSLRIWSGSRVISLIKMTGIILHIVHFATLLFRKFLRSIAVNFCTSLLLLSGQKFS